MIDSAKHQGLRRQLVEKLKKKGIDDSRVLEAITNTPRHWFMDTGLESHAYEDKAYPIAAEQTISSPTRLLFSLNCSSFLLVQKYLKLARDPAIRQRY